MEAAGDNIVDIIRGMGRRKRERERKGAKEIGAISSRLRR